MDFLPKSSQHCGICITLLVEPCGDGKMQMPVRNGISRLQPTIRARKDGKVWDATGQPITARTL